MFRKSTLILVTTALVLVGVSVWCLLPGGSTSKDAGEGSSTSATLQEGDVPLSDGAASADEESDNELAVVQAESSGNLASGTTDKYQTEPVPAGKPAPVEPEKTVPDAKKTYSCTIYIECGKLLEGDNINKLDKNKVGIVPANGVILSKRTVTFSEGESVFDVLLRETRANKIHMEFVNTPIYNSAYIEGIANLYEFDAGNLSGWVYSVNGWFPNYGSSRYQLKNGDKIEWHYTLDLGRDFGLNF
jgi:hypothetical protein